MRENMTEVMELIKKHLAGKELKTPDQHAQEIREYAIQEMEHHVTTQITSEHWRVANPKGWNFGFHIIAPPGALIIYGDLGEMILRHGSKDTKKWAQGSDMSYFLRKVQAYGPGELEQFNYYSAMMELEELIKNEYNSMEDLEAFLEAWWVDDYAPETWHRHWWDKLGGDGVPKCTRYSHHAQYMYHGTQWWANSLP
jgi:hypothetical protein